MALYCTPDDVKAFVRDETLDDVVLGLLIEPVCRAIDNVCHRSFGAVSGDRLYDFSDSRLIRLREDLAALTRVTTNAGQVLLPANFTLRPLGAKVFRSIRVKEGIGVPLMYSGTRDEAITISGLWGYPIVPPEIKAAAEMWTANLYMTSDVRGLQGISSDAVSAQLIQQGLDKPPADTLLFLLPKKRVTVVAVE